MAVVYRIGDDPGLHRVGSNILKNGDKLPQSADDYAFESVIPHVTVLTKDPIECRRKDTEYPLHDPGQALPWSRLDEKVNMVAHDTKIAHREGVFLFRPAEDVEK